MYTNSLNPHNNAVKQVLLILCVTDRHQVQRAQVIPQGHKVHKWQSWDLNPGNLAPKPRHLMAPRQLLHAHRRQFSGVPRHPSSQVSFIPPLVTLFFHEYMATAFRASPSVQGKKD